MPPSLRFPERDIPRALEDVLARAGQDPAARFTDAAAFMTALAAVELTRALPPRAVASASTAPRAPPR